jgi:hypothetical protein
MSNDYAIIILNALEKIDTSRVLKKTDILSTFYMGRQCNVIDCVKAVFTYAQKDSIHMAGEFTFSNDVKYDECTETGNTVQKSNGANECKNIAANSLGDFPSYLKMSAHTFGADSVSIPQIAELTSIAEKYGLQHKAIPLAIMLKGNTNSLFAFINDILTYARECCPVFVLQATVSVNSPTKAEW